MTRRWIAAAALVVVAAACGSRAELDAPTAAPRAARSTALAVGQHDASATTDPVPAAGVDVAEGRVGDDASGAAAGDERAGAVAATVDQEVIRIGFVVSGPASRRQEFVDLWNEILDAALEHANEQGGFGGRRAEHVLAYVEEGLDDAALQRNHQASCTSLTEDEDVDFVMNQSPTGRYGQPCFISHRTPVMTIGLGGLLEADLRRDQRWLLPGFQPHLERWARHVVTLHAEAGHIRGRIGLVALDLPEHRQLAEEIVRPALMASGPSAVEAAYLTPSAGGTYADASAAVLRFRDADVERVFVWLGGGLAWAAMARAADAQGWYPTFLIDSYSFPTKTGMQTMPPGPFSVPQAQLPGTLGVGFDPTRDVHGRGMTTAGERACWSRFPPSTYTEGTPPRREADAKLLEVCAQVDLAQQAFAGTAHRTVERDEIAGLFRSVGQFDHPVQPGTRFDLQKLDGVELAAPLAYDTGCSCFTYTDRWRPIGL